VKFYFTLSIMMQLILAFLSGNKDKIEYMLYLLRGLPGHSATNFESKKPTAETKSEKYTFLLER